MKHLLLILFTVAGLMANAGNGNSNDPEAKYIIKGQVTDKNGDPLTGVEVKIEGTNLKTFTDFDGNFEFTHLKNGEYNLSLTYIAFKDQKIVLKTVQTESEQLQIKMEKKVKF